KVVRTDNVRGLAVESTGCEGWRLVRTTHARRLEFNVKEREGFTAGIWTEIPSPYMTVQTSTMTSPQLSGWLKKKALTLKLKMGFVPLLNGIWRRARRKGGAT
ncbi:unnamed protein product, partial [Ectocarpus fasciculatus]